MTTHNNIIQLQNDDSTSTAHEKNSTKYWELPNRSKRLIYGLQDDECSNTKLLYIKIFQVKFANRPSEQHGYPFAKISLQSWGPKASKSWGDLVDVAYSSVPCQTLNGTWENEVFVFKVDPCGHRLMIEFFNLYEEDEHLLGVFFIDLNEWIPVHSADTPLLKKNVALSENRRMMSLVGLATVAIVYINNLSDLPPNELKNHDDEIPTSQTEWSLENSDEDGPNEELTDSPYRYADSSRAFIIEQTSTVLWRNNVLDTSDQFEELTLVWLNDTVDYGHDYYAHVVCLRDSISHLEIFSNIDDFSHYTNAVNNERIIALVSGAFCPQIERICDEICEIPNIYILCDEDQINHYETIARTKTSIRGVYHNINTVAQELHRHVQQLSNIPATTHMINEGKTTRSLCCKQIKFKCFQMLTKILCQTSPTETVAKEHLLEYCRLANTLKEYGDEEQLREFNDNYSEKQSVYWYTRESFLFRLLNKAARQWDVDALLDFGFYISNLNNQLHELQKQQFSSTSNNTLRVYRGQFMNIDELRKIQNGIGSYISINTFLSTTADEDFALHYARSSSNLYENVLFIIDIDTNDDESQPFAHIEDLSAFPDTPEILLGIGTVFRIEWVQQVTTIEQFTDHWKVYLTICHDKDIIADTDHFDLILLHLTDILQHLSSKTDVINDKMLERCRLYCVGNEVELRKIDSFENSYHSDKAIHEYTKDTFLYRMLNRALRLDDIETILDFRHFILDLYNQLYRVHSDFDRHPVSLGAESKLTVYRGQLISMKELNELKRNIGGYILSRTFLSTTLSSDIASLYAHIDAEDTSYESVLFVIDIDIRRQLRKRPFANINEFSQMRDENEVLFSVGTIFQVKSLKKFTDRLWILHLNLYNDDKHDINEIERHVKLVLLLATHHELLLSNKS